MGLFQSSEEKENKLKEKRMQILKKYGLDTLDEEYAEYVRNVNLNLKGTMLLDLGSVLSRNPEEDIKISYLKSIFEQNWIIIKLLNDIKNKQ